GVAAALDATDAGARVILLEQDDALGGTAATSGGGRLIVGTPRQESLGIRDTPELAFEDWIAWGGGDADETGAPTTSSTRCTISISGRKGTARSGSTSSSRKATACSAGIVRMATAWVS